MTLATCGFALETKVTRRAQFLAEMSEVVPWEWLLAVVAPHYPVAEQGRPRPPLERMLRIYFMQQWFNLSDPAMEDALYDSESMRRFAGIDPGADVVPDESTILRFRHLLEEHQLTQRMFQEVRALLEERQLLLKSGTIVDATIIAAPPSTKHATQSRDPEMKQVRKGNQWYFGMKVPVGTDRRGLVHSLATGPASQGDITGLDELLHGEEREIFGDQAYWSEDHRQHCRHAGIRYRINRRARPGRHLTPAPARHQPAPFRDPRARRACVPGGQDLVGLRQSPVPRTGEEHGACLCGVCAGEPVLGTTNIAATKGPVCLMSGENA
jgi:IS5 family transposase